MSQTQAKKKGETTSGSETVIPTSSANGASGKATTVTQTAEQLNKFTLETSKQIDEQVATVMKEVNKGTNVPEDGDVYVVWVCADGHESPVYVYTKEKVADQGIKSPSSCACSVRNVAKSSKIDVGFASVDRPVAVWFPGREGGLPWVSMMRACDKKFVDHIIVPANSVVKSVQYSVLLE